MVGLFGDQIPLLPSTAITAAAAGVTTTPITGLGGVNAITVQCAFTYGSGGTSLKVWLQTSLDGGTTWIDIMCFAFLTATATKVSAVCNFIALAAAQAPTDAGLTDNTILNGLIGDRIRLKYTSVGTYAATTVKIDAQVRR